MQLPERKRNNVWDFLFSSLMIGIDIRWRGKRLEGKFRGEWQIGNLYDDNGEVYILPTFPSSALNYEDYQIDPNTLGLWIGKRDKYKFPIYTGDLLQDDRERVWKVEMMENLIQIIVKGEDGVEKDPRLFRFEECKVIGTIYDN